MTWRIWGEPCRSWHQRGFPASLLALPGGKGSSHLVAQVVHARVRILHLYTGSVVTGEREKGFRNSFSEHVAASARPSVSNIHDVKDHSRDEVIFVTLKIPASCFSLKYSSGALLWPRADEDMFQAHVSPVADIPLSTREKKPTGSSRLPHKISKERWYLLNSWVPGHLGHYRLQSVP